jgi:hypothetical protein
MDDLKENLLRISAGGGLVLQNAQTFFWVFMPFLLGSTHVFQGPLNPRTHWV